MNRSSLTLGVGGIGIMAVLMVLIVASVYTLANFGADLLYAWLDPRIRYR